jgi:hypothetical protein
MNDQELKNLWQQQKLEPAPALPDVAQISRMREKTATFQRQLKARDFRELAACVVIVVVFAIYFFTTPHLVSRIGDLIVIAGAVFIGWKLIHTRRSVQQPLADAPVKEWLHSELAQVQRQAELLRTIAWWYLLPLYVGVNVSTWGIPTVSLAARISFSVGTGLLYLGIYWLNQWARRRQFLPLEQELEALLRAEEQEQSTNTFAARPPATSRASRDDDKNKPGDSTAIT